MDPLHVRWLGRIPYGEACALQDALVEARRRPGVPDTLLLLEHPPVVTLGRTSRPEHVLVDPDGLAARGIELHASARGGDVTFHGPGQLVGWPVVALRGAERDAHRWLRLLEETMIRTVAAWGVRAFRVTGRTGAWTAHGKIGAIGVRLARGWITSHGFALNVSPDLSGFDAIVPCGIRDGAVTSLARLTGGSPAIADVGDAAAGHLAELLGRRPVHVPLEAAG